ncbi:MAG TPA: creatininase family protein [Xanthobacteraceae bacterium]|nr:creatininase family protein [Xanthobacteraceae bacterium]
MFPKLDWQDMTWEDFAGDTSRWIAVLPVAAIEQHGPHLPVGVDTFIADAYLAAARTQLPSDLPVTFLPRQAIGASDEHRAYPGTLTLSADTFQRMLMEIGESVHRAGLRKLVIANSHGGNVPMLDIAVRDLRVKFGMLAVTCSWARLGYPEGAFSTAEREHGIHAGDIETSIMLAARGDLVRAEKVSNFAPTTLAMEREFKWLRASKPAGFGWMSQDLHQSGAMGDAAAASAAKGKASIVFGANAFVELLGEIDRFDLKRLAHGPLG